MEQDESLQQTARTMRNNFPILYDLRDLLDDTDHGKKIVDNYYSIGRLYLNGNVEIPVAAQVEVVSRILGKVQDIKMFVDEPQSTEILISEEEAGDYQKIIDAAKQYSRDSEYQSVLSFFENELKNVKGKTIQEVHKYLAQ